MGTLRSGRSPLQPTAGFPHLLYHFSFAVVLVNGFVELCDLQRRMLPAWAEGRAIKSATKTIKVRFSYGWGGTPEKELFAGSENCDIPENQSIQLCSRPKFPAVTWK